MKMDKKVTVSPYIVVRDSMIHSKGVFAKRDISKGTRVIEYVGERISKAEAHRRADVPLARAQTDKRYGAVYLFELNKRYDIDGDVPFNPARFINHSCHPNCETDIIRGRIWIIALRDIPKGEEVTYNYGYGFDDYEEHECRCGSARCVGYILAEEHWAKLRRRIVRKKTHKDSRKGS